MPIIPNHFSPFRPLNHLHLRLLVFLVPPSPFLCCPDTEELSWGWPFIWPESPCLGAGHQLCRLKVTDGQHFERRE
ncbi:hypothetical protein O3P69_020387 [Scylla paramamosain]|uniref:Secreted protein n=1 Tax=Scylla paramamosain TaxID=85552 RepID=A0AAW0TMA5_SCYPA